MKSVQKRLHMITFACFENQFHSRGLNLLWSPENVKVKWTARTKRITIV